MIRPPMIRKLKKKIRAMPEINLTEMGIPLTNGKPTPNLKDILEKDVPLSFYLNKEIVERIVAQSGFKVGLISIKTPKE